MTDSTTIIALLGTGNPNPDPSHQGPSIALIVNQIPYIIDFGPGLIRQAASLTPEYGGNLPALEARNLQFGFLTHLHSDHTIGLPDLILTPWVMGRDQPLKLFGPVGTEVLVNHLLKAYQTDIEYRMYGSEPANDRGWQVTVREFTDGVIYQDENIMAEAFAVQHGSWPNAFGFRFTTPDKTIVISGDTAPCENIRNFSQGVDILIHEAFSYQAYHQQKDPLWQAYHMSHHTSTLELAELSNEVRPGLVVVYHTLYWGASDQAILAEIATIYDGPVVIGSDRLIIE
jgi:ribonuclease Z